MPEMFDQTELKPLGRLADIRVSNVDKKTVTGEFPVRLCNYTDVYNADYLSATHPYMHASATHAEIQRFAVQANDVIITKDSETPDDIGVAAVIDDAAADMVCGYHLAMIRPSAALNPVWLAKQFGHHRLQRHLSRVAAGTTRYGLSNGAIENLPIFVLPREQQDFAARVFRTLDETIRKTEQLIAKLQQAKQGLLHDLLTRGIDDNGELRDPERHPEQFKDSVLGRIPKDWAIEPIGSLGDVVTGNTPSSAMLGAWGDDIPFVTPGDIAEDVLSHPTRWLSSAGRRVVRELPAATLLTVCIGSTIGKIAVAEIPCATNQQINALVPSGSVDVHFIAAALRMQRSRLLALAGLQAVPIINATQYKSILVVLPALSEQRRIALIIQGADSEIEAEGNQLDKLRVLKTGLMDDLLTGRVRVPA